jgi:ATP-dependent phosphoenolpyruvate carboxykinase
LEHTMAILDSLLRGGLEDWEDSPTGFKIPKAIRMVDDIYLHPEKLYTKEEFEEKQKTIDKFRRKAIRKVGEGIPPEIKKVFKTKRKPKSI